MEQKYYSLELTEQELFTIFCLIEDERDNILESIRENPELVREDYIQDSLENTKNLSDYIITVLDEDEDYEDLDEEDYEDEDETEESEFAGQLVNFDFTDEFSKDETEDEQEYNDEDYLVNRYSKPNQEVREAPIELDDFLKQLTASGIDFKLINLSDLQKEAPEPKKLTTEQLKQKLFDNLSPEERKLVDALASDIKNVMSQFKPR
jgi:hypothetical protein